MSANKEPFFATVIKADYDFLLDEKWRVFIGHPVYLDKKSNGVGINNCEKKIHVHESTQQHIILINFLYSQIAGWKREGGGHKTEGGRKWPKEYYCGFY